MAGSQTISDGVIPSCQVRSATRPPVYSRLWETTGHP